MRDLRRIAIIREDRLGDSCVSLPVLEALQDLSPQSRVTWIGQAPWLPLFEGHPMVERVIPCPRKPGYLEMFSFAAELRQGSYDAVLLLRASVRWQQAAKWSGIKLRVGPTAKMSNGFLTHDSWIETRARTHNAQRALDVLSTALDCKVGDYPAVLRLKPSALEQALTLMKDFALPENYYIVQLGTGGSNYPVPPSLFGEVSSELKKDGLVPVMTGTQSEAALGAEFEVAYGEPVRSVAGKTDIPLLSEVVRRARFILSCDTGTTHLGATVGTRSVVLMPRVGIPDTLWRPWMVDHEIVRPTKYCANCLRIVCYSGDGTCTSSFESASVLDACRRLISRLS